MASFTRSRAICLLSRSLKNGKISDGVSRGYAEAASGQMDFTFASANKVFYANKNIRQVDVPASNCAFGILPNHVPTLAVLKPGIVTVFEEDGSSKRIFVSSGTVTVNDDSSVQILAQEAHDLADFDASAASAALQVAEKELSSAQTEVEKAEAQIAVEAGQAIVAALGGGSAH